MKKIKMLIFFKNKLNDMEQGPYTVNRGYDNPYLLGQLRAYQGNHGQSCNGIRGTDSITWPPMDDSLPHLFAYTPEICRFVYIKSHT